VNDGGRVDGEDVMNDDGDVVTCDVMDDVDKMDDGE
jgi:hypothetical protein